MSRSIQDLLEERRQNVLEQSHENDPIARQMLQAHINHIDQLIAEQDEADEYAWEKPGAFDLVDPEIEAP